MKYMDEAWLARLDDAFEPTPATFHQAVEQRLMELRAAVPQQRSFAAWRRPLGILIALFLLLCGVALALDRLGVVYFMTERIMGGAQPQAVENHTLLPSAQACNSALLSAEVRDVYLDGETRTVRVHIAPQDPQRYRLLSETDIGTDGEHFDRIWWQGEVLTFDEWLPEGKQMLVVDATRMEIGDKRLLLSQDWVTEAQGETFSFEGDLSRLDAASALNADGSLSVRLLLTYRMYGEDEQETVTITFTLPNAAEHWKGSVEK